MKYIGINLRLEGSTRRLIVAFPNDLIHAIVAKWIGRACREQWPEAQVTVASAGDIDALASETTGKSETLNLSANPNDQRFFNNSDYGGHIV